MALKYGARKGASREINRDIVQQGTVKDLEDMLNSHQIALMIRPTGFGKTHLMLELCKKEKYNKVLYIYPTAVIMQSIFESYHKCDEAGNIIPPSNKKDGIKFAANEEEHIKYPDLPYLEFRSYMKMLIDWRYAYRNTSDISWEEQSYESKKAAKKEWQSLSEEDKLKIRKKWLAQTLGEIELMILDEAHTAGAEGFLSYWPYIKELTSGGAKKNRLHVVGATATPLRTDPKIDIEKDVFSYTRANKLYSARIPDFTFIDCWRCGLMSSPYYTKGILDKEYQKEVLEKAIYEGLLGKIEPTSRASSILSIDTTYLGNKRKLYKDELAKFRSSFEKLRTPPEIIRDAVAYTARNKVENGDYLRFLVFYQNTEDLIQFHSDINQAVLEAFDVARGNKYSKLNESYIATNKDKLDGHGIEPSDVSTIAIRDKEIKGNPEIGRGNIDVIHSIDVLNMGYHVGNVTGVIVKRSTASEIKYYQQIGRCMSVVDDNRPLIIDFANADAELFKSSHDTLRDEAGERIKEFISNCEQSEDCRQLNLIYSACNLYMSYERADDSLLDYWYFDRLAPIYFIKGILESLHYEESLESIVKRLRSMSINKYDKQEVELDDYLLSEVRVSQRLKGTVNRPGIIRKEAIILKDISKEDK